MCIENRHTCLSFNGEHTNWRIIASSALKIMTRKMMTAFNVNIHCWFLVSVGTDREPFPSNSSWESDRWSRAGRRASQRCARGRSGNCSCRPSQRTGSMGQVQLQLQYCHHFNWLKIDAMQRADRVNRIRETLSEALYTRTQWLMIS